MQLRLLTQHKFLIPLVLLLWLGTSVFLAFSPSISQAAVVNDSACRDTNNWDQGVWGQTGGSPHLSLLNKDVCYQVSGTLVWGEWWKDYPNDSYGCKTTDQQTAYSTCSDEDTNWYLRLSKSERTDAGVTSGEIKKLQRWSECKAGERDRSKWCHFLTESIPAGGNYGMWDTSYDWDPTNDQPQLPNACLDQDFNPNTKETNPCKGKNIQISYTGARVKDNNHGWKEIHPTRKEKWTDGSGSHCYYVNDTNQSSPLTC
jgi:hypothetical protein